MCGLYGAVSDRTVLTHLVCIWYPVYEYFIFSLLDLRRSGTPRGYTEHVIQQANTNTTLVLQKVSSSIEFPYFVWNPAGGSAVATPEAVVVFNLFLLRLSFLALYFSFWGKSFFGEQSRLTPMNDIIPLD